MLRQYLETYAAMFSASPAMRSIKEIVADLIQRGASHCEVFFREDPKLYSSQGRPDFDCDVSLKMSKFCRMYFQILAVDYPIHM